MIGRDGRDVAARRRGAVDERHQGLFAESALMLRKSSSEPVVVPPGLLMLITTPDTELAFPTRSIRSAMRWFPAMKPLTEIRATWD